MDLDQLERMLKKPPSDIATLPTTPYIKAVNNLLDERFVEMRTPVDVNLSDTHPEYIVLFVGDQKVDVKNWRSSFSALILFLADDTILTFSNESGIATIQDTSGYKKTFKIVQAPPHIHISDALH